MLCGNKHHMKGGWGQQGHVQNVHQEPPTQKLWHTQPRHNPLLHHAHQTQPALEPSKTNIVEPNTVPCNFQLSLRPHRRNNFSPISQHFRYFKTSIMSPSVIFSRLNSHNSFKRYSFQSPLS